VLNEENILSLFHFFNHPYYCNNQNPHYNRNALPPYSH
jgi:hypothetical protein